MSFMNFIRISPIFGSIYALLKLYEIVFLIRIILSWIRLDPYNPLVQFLFSITDPVMEWVRRYIPIRIGMLDFSPLLIFVALWILEKIALQLVFIFHI